MAEYIFNISEEIRDDGSQEILNKKPLIRCKDCKYYFNGCCYSRVSNRINFTVEVPDEWFCADGERK